MATGRIQRTELINAMNVLVTRSPGYRGIETGIVRRAYNTQRRDFDEIAQASISYHALAHLLAQIGESREVAYATAGMIAAGMSKGFAAGELS